MVSLINHDSSEVVIICPDLYNFYCCLHQPNHLVASGLCEENESFQGSNIFLQKSPLWRARSPRLLIDNFFNLGPHLAVVEGVHGLYEVSKGHKVGHVLQP